LTPAPLFVRIPITENAPSKMMPRLVCLLLLTLGSLSTSARVDGLGDGLVAYQEVVRAHKVGRSSFELGLVEAVRKAASQNAHGDAPAKTDSKTITLEWRTTKVEEGTTVSVKFDHGCKEKKSGFTTCAIDLKDVKNSVALDIKLKKPLDNDAKVASEMSVKMGFMKAEANFKCPICGGTCQFKMMGFPIKTETPKCPIPGTGISLDLPLNKVSQLPNIPSFSSESKSKVIRGDGTVVAVVEVKVSM